MSETMTIDELIEEFEELGDWEAKCEYLIDIGLELPRLPAEVKIEPNRVHGCQSNVWMIPQLQLEERGATVDFEAESDAMIVNGLIAVLKIIYAGKSPDEILNLEIKDYFSQLGLDRQLSPQRKNGLSGMVKRIKDFAASHSTSQ